MYRFFAFVLIVFASASCSKKTTTEMPKLHPVNGVVVKNGAAVSGGGLFIRSDQENSNLMISATVGADGRFTVVSMDTQDSTGKKNPGAPEGTYQITYAPPGQDQGVTPVILATRFTVEAKTNEWTIELVEKK